MNDILGARIRSLREVKGFTQGQIAEKMHCTRQKIARMEKGLIDISYASMNEIAQILGIAVSDITSAVRNSVKPQPMYRANGSLKQEDKFDFISNMLDTFYAHRKLYTSIRQTEHHE